MINLLKGLFSDSNEDEEENIFSKSDDEVPEESENKSENDWEKFSTVEDKEEKSAFEEAREEAKSNEGLKLSESVSSGYANPQDTAKVKYGLNRTGYYNDDISTIPNQKMLDGVKSFQKDNNLRIDGKLNPTGETITAINKKMKEKKYCSLPKEQSNTKDISLFEGVKQATLAAYDMSKEYFKMKSHNYVKLDDYHHCKANYNEAKRGIAGYNTAKYLGDLKESFDYYRNMWYKGFSARDAQRDKEHDLLVNADGRLKGAATTYNNAKDACAKYRELNSKFPKELW